jgi:hypothetical protein
VIKAGISHGKQRHKCKDCAIHFVKHYKRLSERDRLRAVQFCSYGMSMNTVAKMFFITTTSVARWIKRYKRSLDKSKLTHESYDRIFAEIWKSSPSKHFKRQCVLKFQITLLKDKLKTIQMLKVKKIN